MENAVTSGLPTELCVLKNCRVLVFIFHGLAPYLREVALVDK